MAGLPGVRVCLAASLTSTAIRWLSVGGRIWGHARRGGLWGVLLHICLNFDWFCGMAPLVMAHEQRKAALRLGVYVCVAAAVAVAAAVLSAWLQLAAWSRLPCLAQAGGMLCLVLLGCALACGAGVVYYE